MVGCLLSSSFRNSPANALGVRCFTAYRMIQSLPFIPKYHGGPHFWLFETPISKTALDVSSRQFR